MDSAERESLQQLERANWLLEHGCIDPILTNGPGQQEKRLHAAMRILRKHPEVARADIHTAVLCGDVEEAKRILKERPSAAVERGGPIRFRYNKARESLWSPILHLCYGRLPIPAASENAIAIATLLLDHGANPNDYFEAGSHPSRYTALTGLIGGGEENTPVHPEADALVSLLLERGANPLDVQMLYNSSLSGTVFRWFDRLYEVSLKNGSETDWAAPTWNPKLGISALDWLMHAAHEQKDEARLQWLVEHGARVLPIVEQTSSTVSNDEFIAACFAMDEVTAKRLLLSRPELLNDHRALFAAASENRVDVVEFVLNLGVPIDVEDESKQQALHIAASSDAFDAVRLLIARGGDMEVHENNWNNTPLDHAMYGNHTRMIELLASYSRNVFKLASVGTVARLREVLLEDPARAKQVVDGETPLMYLPDDEVRAVQVVRLLLEFGADASVTDSNGRTAAYYARKHGLYDAALLMQR